MSEVLVHGCSALLLVDHRAAPQRLSVHLAVAGKRRQSQERLEEVRAPISLQGHTPNALNFCTLCPTPEDFTPSV